MVIVGRPKNRKAPPTDTNIRLTKTTREELKRLLKPGEIYDDLLRRLIGGKRARDEIDRRKA